MRILLKASEPNQHQHQFEHLTPTFGTIDSAHSTAVMDIKAMLNPSGKVPRFHNSAPLDNPVDQETDHSGPRSTPKALTTPKDGFMHKKKQPVDPIHYPPYEVRRHPDIGLQLDKYQVKPDQEMGKFFDFPRYIPYGSEKQDLWRKTGRKGFHGKLIDRCIIRDTYRKNSFPVRIHYMVRTR